MSVVGGRVRGGSVGRAGDDVVRDHANLERSLRRSFGFKNSVVSCDFLNDGKNVESTSFNIRIQN